MARNGVRSRPAIEPHGPAVKIVGVDVTQHDVGIRDGRPGAAAAVAHGTRIGAGAFWADLDEPHVGMGKAATASADLEQLDSRHVDGEAATLAIAHLIDLEGGSDRRLPAIDGAELGRGSAHVECEYALDVLLLADDAAQQHARCGSRFDDANRHVAGKLG